MPVFLSLFTQSAAVMDLGVRYSRVAFAFSVFVGVSMSMEKIFQAAGRMVMTMVCMLAGCVCNIVLDPVLIFGYGRSRRWASRERRWPRASARC